MTALSEILAGWVNAVGWTLVHSLWQGLIICGLVVGIVRLIPSSRSAVRYGVACLGLSAFVIFIGMTLAHQLYHSESQSMYMRDPGVLIQHASFSEQQDENQTGVIHQGVALLEKNMSLVVMAWAAGCIFFLLRFSISLTYTFRIRSGAQPVDGPWQDFVRDAARRLGITKAVTFAESASITTPMVIGFLKPIILAPAGMMAGLTASQMETVLLHELAHIKRHDFLVNFFQTVVETIFFFNPFVWILSNEIRREREYCCDDLVMRQHGDAFAYAHALVRLAEARLTPTAFAVPLAADKNILLNRIKRIMEKSLKHSGKGRLVFPAVILALGMLSISWIATEKKDGNVDNAQIAAEDTLPDKKVNAARYSRRSIITFDENGQPHEEIVEEFEGDEDLRAMIEQGIPRGFDSSFITGFPDFGSAPFAAMRPDLQDTIPPFRGRNWDEWAESFNESFEELLGSKSEHFENLERMMQQLEERFRSENWSAWENSLRENLRHDSLRALIDSSAFRNMDHFRDLEEQLEKLRELEFKSFEHFGDRFGLPGATGAAEQSLREQLVEDGYLSADEPINSLEWNDDYFKVNGKKVRPEHLEKYNELRERIFR